MNNNGFTLIELLVVIVLIGILSLVAFNNLDFVGYTNRANDVRRITDIRLIYESINRDLVEGKIKLKSTDGKYVYSSKFSNPSTGTGFVMFENTSGISNYQLGGYPQLPRDPKQEASVTYSAFDNDNRLFSVTDNSARYIYCSDGKRFKIATILEADTLDRFTNRMRNDAGTLTHWYEVGTDLSLCGGIGANNVSYSN